MPRGEVNKWAMREAGKKLEGRVKNMEAYEILGDLRGLSGPDWLATIDKLKATPSDEPGLSLLDKFVKYGVSDRSEFIADFADQINIKLELGLPTLADRATAHEARGMSDRRAERVAGREIREDAEVLLRYFNSKDKPGFWNSAAEGAGVAGAGALRVVTFPLRALLGVIFGDGPIA